MSSYGQRRIDHFLKIAHRAWGVDVVFRPLGNPANDFTLNTINDRRYMEVHGTQSSHPMSGVTVSEIEAEISRKPGKGDQLVIDSVVFNIIEFIFDGHDDSKLILHEA